MKGRNAVREALAGIVSGLCFGAVAGSKAWMVAAGSGGWRPLAELCVMGVAAFAALASWAWTRVRGRG